MLGLDGQMLMPFMLLVEQGRVAVDELISVMGCATVEKLLELSAENVAGKLHRGRLGGPVIRHGHQRGVVRLSDRKLRVKRPRLRSKLGGEVVPPAYAAMRRHPRLGERLLEILMAGVSTRNYGRVLPEMAGTLGISRSAVSRKFVAVSAGKMKELCERDLRGLDLLAMYIDGLHFGEHVVVAAVGVDTQGCKHVLGLAEGATENGTVCKGLLAGLVERGVDPGKKYLFVIDGAKALRQAIVGVFGQEHKVQRCRNHKIDNVCSYLPKELRSQVRAAMKAAYRLGPDEGIKKLKQQVRWLEVEYPSAAESLLEGLEETFTINRMDLSAELRRCLGTTNLIENPHSAVRRRSGRVCNWKNGRMVMRWAGTAFLDAEKNFRRIMGFKDIWMLEVELGRKSPKRLKNLDKDEEAA